MTKYKVDSNSTVTSIKNAIRGEVVDFIIDSLKAQYGEDAVFYIRTGSETSPKTELCVEVSEVEADGNVVPVYAPIGTTIKSFVESVGPKKTTPAFDVEAARQAYEDHLEAMAEKEAAKAAKKKTKESDDNSF